MSRPSTPFTSLAITLAPLSCVTKQFTLFISLAITLGKTGSLTYYILNMFLIGAVDFLVSLLTLQCFICAHFLVVDGSEPNSPPGKKSASCFSVTLVD